MTLVRFLKPITFAGTVTMVTYNFNASANVEGYLDDDLAQALIDADIAEEIT
jgi:hypothetical protein